MQRLPMPRQCPKRLLHQWQCLAFDQHHHMVHHRLPHLHCLLTALQALQHTQHQHTPHQYHSQPHRQWQPLDHHTQQLQRPLLPRHRPLHRLPMALCLLRHIPHRLMLPWSFNRPHHQWQFLVLDQPHQSQSLVPEVLPQSRYLAPGPLHHQSLFRGLGLPHLCKFRVPG